MSHYSSADWRLFSRGGLERARRFRMQQHLLKCDSCLQDYLSTIGEREEEMAALLLPPEFENSLGNFITQKRQEANRIRRPRLLFNYAAAALITLALIAGGVFDTVTAAIPVLLKETRSFSRMINETAAVSWSDELVETATQQIDRFFSTEED
ncbi:MAG: hypothetical protein AB1767_01535 [Bacillota bacterium]